MESVPQPCGKGGHRNEREVFAELCVIAEETLALYRSEGRPLPPPTAGRDLESRRVGAT